MFLSQKIEDENYLAEAFWVASKRKHRSFVFSLRLGKKYAVDREWAEVWITYTFTLCVFNLVSFLYWSFNAW